MATKIYVSRLNRKTSEDSLRSAFCDNGVFPMSVEIKQNLVGIDSRGYGFVIVDDDDVDAALDLDGIIIDGRELSIKEAMERGYRKPVTMENRDGDY